MVWWGRVYHSHLPPMPSRTADSDDPSALAGIAKALPALKRAQKLGKRASRVGFDWPDRRGVEAKIAEELEELDEAAGTRDRARIGDEVGDLLFAVVNLARHLTVDAESALAAANGKFERRFRFMEQYFDRQGHDIEAVDREALEAAWERAKQHGTETP